VMVLYSSVPVLTVFLSLSKALIVRRPREHTLEDLLGDH